MQKHLYMATKRKKNRERLYSMEDAVFYERSRTLTELFKRNVAAFTAFDFNLDMAYHFVSTGSPALREPVAFTPNRVARRRPCWDTVSKMEIYLRLPTQSIFHHIQFLQFLFLQKSPNQD